VVSDIVSYPENAVPGSALFANNDGAHLNLITCDGQWVANEKSYDHRLVVFSNLAS